MKRVNLLKGFFVFIVSVVMFAGCDDTILPCSFNVPDSAFPEGDRKSAVVIYPCNIDSMNGPIDSTTVSGGFSNTKEDMFWLAEYLRDEGNMIVIAVSASNNNTVDSYENAHKAGVGILKEANRTEGNPVYGKVGKIAVAGYSMGGAGALQAANDLRDEINAAIGMAPYKTGSIVGLTVPTAIIVGSKDTVAPPAMAHDTYTNIPAGLPKSYGELNGENHLYWVNNDTDEVAKKYILSWFKYNMSSDDSYLNFLISPPADFINYEYIQ